MIRSTSIVSILVVAATTGCFSREPDQYLDRPEQQVCVQEMAVVPTGVSRDIDILFIIDNSSSMAQEQASLATNYRRLMTFLDEYYGGLPNIHVGVVSTDLGAGPYSVGNCQPGGDGGALQHTARGDCTPPDGTYITNVAVRDGTDDRNYSGTLPDTFSCIAELGSGGCDFPQPLEAMRKALDGSNPTNAGFVRDDAFLMVVFITDDDDCSASDTALFDPDATDLGPATAFRCFEYGTQCDPDAPRVAGDKQACQPRQDSAYLFNVQSYVDFLKGLKADPNMVIAAGITGGEAVAVGVDKLGRPQLAASCSSPSAQATPATRLGYFLAQFPQRGAAISICEEDLTGVFEILQPVTSTRGAYCMPGELDMDLNEPGVQHDCVVSDVTARGTSSQTETLIPECTTLPPMPGQFPCWYFEVDPFECPETTTQFAIRVERGRASVHDVSAVVQCAASMCEPDLGPM